MHPNHFERCIAYLNKNFEIKTFEELTEEDKKGNNKIATIMFDDGYKDNWEYAFPILEKYGVKASFYIITDSIKNNLPAWTQVLDYTFQLTNKQNVTLPFDFLENRFKKANFKTKRERIAFAKVLKPFLKNVTHEQREQVMQLISTHFNDVEIPKIMMSWEHIKELSNKGHYIGSHTVTHPMLGTIASKHIIKKELYDSAKEIESQLGYFPKTISYPVGSYNETVISLSKEVGYTYGLAVQQRPYLPEKHGNYCVPRMELYNEFWFKTRLRMANRMAQIKRLIKK